MIFSNIYIAVYIHEDAHKKINKYYGCDSEILLSFEGGKTAFTGGCNLTKETRNSLIESQAQVEASGSVVIPILVALWFSVLFLYITRA